MFYYLIYYSSITEYYEREKKCISTFFWGTILYVITHACLTSSLNPLITQLYKSFFIIILLDLLVMGYTYWNLENDQLKEQENIVNDLLKNVQHETIKLISKDVNEEREEKEEREERDEPQPDSDDGSDIDIDTFSDILKDV